MSEALRYLPGVEQRAIAEVFNDSLKALLPLERLHDLVGEDSDTWAQLDDIGLFSISVPEEGGGSGLGAAEEALIAMELGRCLAAPSVFASIGATHAPSPLPGGMGSGARTAAGYRAGGRDIIIGDTSAQQVLLRDAGSAWLCACPASVDALDSVLWDARLESGQLSVADGVQFDPAGLLRLRLNDAAALAGIASLALDMGVAYAKERHQFGRPIGAFQAVKHHCANMAIAARNAADQVGFAAVAIDEKQQDAALQVDCALLVAGIAALRNSGTNIQVHGGIGFSEEALPHLLLKRSQVLITIAGGLESASARIAAASHER